jgi:HSP20 family molecular chaperone IbpA
MFVSTFPSFPVRYRVRTPYVHTRYAHRTTPAVAGRWADGVYELTADLPGVPQDAVAVSVAGRTLSIDVATDELTWTERIRLPQTLDAEQVSARYVDGRLTVTIAKTAEAEPRSIAIEVASGQPELATGDEAQSAEVEAGAIETSVTE